MQKGLKIRMDVFIEHLVKKRPTGVDTAKKIGLVLAVLLIVAACFMLVPPQFMMFAFLIICGSGYGAYWLISGMSVEYEYILTNGEIDIDKIIAQRKRKRLISVHSKTFESFGPYKMAEHANRNYDNRILACESEDSEGVYYATFRHRTLGHCLLVFNPDERIIKGIKSYLPRTAGGNANYGNRPDIDQ